MNTIAQLVEASERPGLLGLSGKVLEKRCQNALEQYFAQLKSRVVALNLHKIVDQPKPLVQMTVDAALHNVLRKESTDLERVLYVNIFHGILLGSAQDTFAEAVDLKEYDPDQPRDMQGRWSSIGAPSKAVTSKLLGHTVTSLKVQRAYMTPDEYAILKRGIQKEEVAGPIHRGIQVKAGHPMLGYKVGDTFELAPQSFSKSETVAKHFANQGFGKSSREVGDKRVLVTVDNPMVNGIDAASYAWINSHEQEVVSGGHFQVKSKKEGPHSIHYVVTQLRHKIKEADTFAEAFDPDQPRDKDGKWTAGGYIDVQAQGEGRLKSMKIFQHAQQEPPWALIGDLNTEDPNERHKPHEFLKAPKFEEVPTSSLIPTQGGLDAVNAAAFMKEGHKQPVVVVKTKAGYMLIDGHHRAAGAIGRGDKNIAAWVYYPKAGAKEVESAKEADATEFLFDVTGPLAQNAADYAQRKAAELVVGINETTRDLIAGKVADGIENQLGVEGTARSILEELANFTRFRARVIATTEMNSAMSEGTLQKLRSLEIEYKRWIIADGDADEICKGNADDGAIPVDESFSSGDDRPPAHPNCRCALVGSRPPEGEQA